MRESSPLAKLIGANIVAERKNADVTQGWLADRIGVGQSVLSNTESGYRTPTVEQLVRIAQALGCPVVALLKGAGEEPAEYRKGYADGWRDRTDDMAAHLTRTPTGGAS